jgi:hypothetical protein
LRMLREILRSKEAVCEYFRPSRFFARLDIPLRCGPWLLPVGIADSRQPSSSQIYDGVVSPNARVAPAE